jgi:D-alanyl-D-alanine carboxypeptidase/D-alanyl-D-alanine-endopeptidase (penicillin-binding protein 4)
LPRPLEVAFLALLLALAPAARAADALGERLDAIFGGAALRDAEVGVAILDLETGAPLYERDAGRPLIPASNEKLVTTACALDRLGGGHRFETLLFRAGELRGDTLQGDLIVRGGGDPCMDARFDGVPDAVPRRFARALREAGIRRVTGDVVADDRLFDREFRHPGWPRDQLDRWYTAPVSALSLNDACVDVTVAPGARPGLPVAVTLAPACALFEVDLRAITTGERREHVISVERRLGTDRLIVRGAALAGAQPVSTSVTVEDPALFFAAVLRERLVEEGVAVGGRARLFSESDAAREVVPVAGHVSLLAEALPVTNKRSQNFYAEMLLKSIAAAEGRGPGSFAGGAAALARFLREGGAREGSFVIEDGSGLARGNRIAPREIARLLVRMAGHREAALYVASLAAPGEPGGTLEGRIRSPLARGRVRAKTGTIHGVSALSGYVFSKDEALLPRRGVAFSILANGLRRGVGPAREAQDACVSVLLEALAAPPPAGEPGEGR